MPIDDIYRPNKRDLYIHYPFSYVSAAVSENSNINLTIPSNYPLDIIVTSDSQNTYQAMMIYKHGYATANIE